MNHIIAFDPGAQGGIAWNDAESIVHAVKMPESWTDRADKLRELTCQCRGRLVAYIEKVHAMPGNGACSMFTFGGNYFGLIAMCAYAAVPVIDVQPGAWTKFYNLGTQKSCASKSEWKNKLKAQAQKLFPHLEVSLATADALLIHHYAYQTHKF